MEQFTIDLRRGTVETGAGIIIGDDPRKAAGRVFKIRELLMDSLPWALEVFVKQVGREPMVFRASFTIYKSAGRETVQGPSSELYEQTLARDIDDFLDGAQRWRMRHL